MLWYTIVSEIAREIVNDPEKFKHLFSNKSEKVKLLVTTNCEYDINVNEVDKLLNNNVLNYDFKNIITETKFDSQVENFDLAIKIAFAYMASPYFDYLTTRCGIPHVEVLGREEEYKLLYNKITELKKYVPEFSNYLDGCGEIVNDLIYWCFDDKTIKPVLSSCDDAEMFLSGIFYIKQNCGSGHPYNIYGWINKFYMKNHHNLSKYPAHLNYIPYEFVDNQTYYYKAIGLSYSEYDEEKNILRPQYGYTIHQVFDKELFNCLKN